ncbi:hypothetical protein QOZ88_19275 [Blastococcus sp. BMG 814]|uniref:Uncharacterized protein n=1 Tax=Blastococcus carthaginiensis TaxID=3050034 RepID=A0ABT9II86_9ACTN|nr:hypothetical protein [Blastococcus carthaginiensis]MDP5184780.1 hypothetical protein [Blastococcus carthaginiensis]
MSAPGRYSQLCSARGEVQRAERARRNEQRISAAPLPGLWPKPSSEAASVPAALRRRQAAARRLPPLADGRRDPIAPPRHQVVLEVEVGKRTAWFYGLTRRQFIALCRRAGVARWMEDTRTFCVHVEDSAEMLAVAEHALRWRTVVTAVNR